MAKIPRTRFLHLLQPVVNMPEEDRATDIGNMHKNLVKIARVVPEISSRTDRHTDRQTYLSQHFATALVGEVIMKKLKTKNEMLRRNGPVIKSVESVSMTEGSLWWERFIICETGTSSAKSEREIEIWMVRVMS